MLRKLCRILLELFSSGLTELSDAAAESLASTKQSMFLWGIKKLSVNAAKSSSTNIVMESRGELFDGLTELPECLAERLSKERKVNLPNIKSISPTAAESLSWQDDHYAELDLSGLRSCVMIQRKTCHGIAASSISQEWKYWVTKPQRVCLKNQLENLHSTTQ